MSPKLPAISEPRCGIMRAKSHSLCIKSERCVKHQQHHHAVRQQAAVRKHFRQVRRRQPLRPDRRQRLRQVHLHEDPRRRSGADRRQRLARSERAPGQAAPGPVRLRRLQRARHRDHGPRRTVGGEGRARPHLRPAGDERRRRLYSGRAGSRVRRDGRLHRRSARRRAAAGRGHSGGTALRPDERRRAGLEAARAAGAGAVLRPGHPAARRTDQQPGHQHHPLAGGRCSTSATAP